MVLIGGKISSLVTGVKSTQQQHAQFSSLLFFVVKVRLPWSFISVPCVCFFPSVTGWPLAMVAAVWQRLEKGRMQNAALAD